MNGLIEYLGSRYQKVVEVGVGHYTKVALALKARGLCVVVTDVHSPAIDIPVELDDVTTPRLELYRGAEAIYAVRPPPELIPALRNLAERLAVDLIIKPLSSEPVDGVLVSEAGCFFYLIPYGKGKKEALAQRSESSDRPRADPEIT